MKIVEFLLLLNVLAFCVYSSITDIRNSVIQNKAVLWSLLAGLVLNIVYYLFFAKDYRGIFIVNLLIISAVSIILYALSLWAAGDAKMMIAVVFSLPGRLYDTDLASGIAPALSIIVTAFSAAFLYIVFDSLVQRFVHKDGLNIEFKGGMQGFVREYIICMIYVFFCNNAVLTVMPNLYYSNMMLFSIIDMFVVIVVTKYPIFRNKWLLIGLGTFDIVMEVMKWVKSGPVRVNWFVYVCFAIILLLRMSSEQYSYKIIPTAEIKKGMVLSRASVLSMAISKVKGLPKFTTEDMRSRISSEEAEAIRRWEDSKYGKHEIEIVRKLPFGIFISIGVLMMVVLRIQGLR